MGQVEIDDKFHTAPELNCVPAQCRGPGDHGVIRVFEPLIALTICHVRSSASSGSREYCLQDIGSTVD